MSNLSTADTLAKSSLDDAYVSSEDRVLNPDLLDKTLLERMPNPAGWKLLVFSADYYLRRCRNRTYLVYHHVLKHQRRKSTR